MAYYAGALIPHHERSYFSKIREIRERESRVRDAEASKMIEKLNEQREESGNPIPDHALVCRSMKHLPARGGI